MVELIDQKFSAVLLGKDSNEDRTLASRSTTSTHAHLAYSMMTGG